MAKGTVILIPLRVESPSQHRCRFLSVEVNRSRLDIGPDGDGPLP